MVARGLMMTTPGAEKDIAERPRQALQDEMSDVRRLIDELDEELVALLAKRQRQIERAARIKPALGIPANVPERVDEVLAHVLGAARREGLSVEVAMTLWRTLIDWSIQYEERLMGARALKGDSQGSADDDRSS
jgi:isochorismate pyruvate lyase